MIKRILFMAVIVLMVLMAVSAKEKEIDYVILSGKIENPNSDSLVIRDKADITLHKIKLRADHTFLDTIRVKPGYYSIFDGTEQTQVYLKPGFVLNLSLNTKQFDETIVYKGKGANENNFLAKKALAEESFGILNYYGYYGKLEEKAFLKLTDSLHDVMSNLVNQYKNEADKDFMLKESKALEFGRLYKWMNYESMHRFLTDNKEFKVSPEFPDYVKYLDLSDESLLDVEFYTSLIEGHLYDLTSKAIKGNDSADYYGIYLGFVATEIKSPVARELLAYNVGKWRLSNVKKLDPVYTRLKTLISNESYMKEVDAKYAKLKKIQQGAVSPAFILNDINGKEVSLESLKGKLVYIDIWATWCLPCIKEIPALKALEEHYKGRDIQFVSICKSDEIERWRSMVKEKELGGIQLFAPDPKMSFFEDYLVDGIPYFILLDKEGRIIKANAMRPSDEKLKEQIDKLL
jgi:thiol-disulfide isomerase/thioredoxin